MMGSRLFFVVCLALSVGLFGLLTGGTWQAQTVTTPEDVRAGLDIWRAYGCEGCHTLYGHGGAYAPDLTHIITLRGDDYLGEFMLNPGAFHPGRRVMPRFTLTRDEIHQLIAFLRYTGGRDGGVAVDWFTNMQVAGTGGLQVAFLSSEVAAAPGEDLAVAKGRQIFAQRCASCHSLVQGVVQTGPSLWGIADRAWHRIPGVGPEDYIRNSVLNPGDYIVEGFPNVMQKNLGEMLTSADLDNLIAFLMTLQES